MAKITVKTVGIRAIRKKLGRARLGPLTKTMHNRMTILWRNAAEAFIRAAVRHVLVESGMSAASFFPLSRAIKRVKAASVIRSRVAEGGPSSRKSIATLPTGAVGTGRPSPSAGEKLGKKAFRFNVGGPRRPVFEFQFTTVVFQHAFHEPNLGGNSLSVGLDAFNESLKEKFLKIMALTLSEFLGLKKTTRRIVEGA